MLVRTPHGAKRRFRGSTWALPRTRDRISIYVANESVRIILICLSGGWSTMGGYMYLFAEGYLGGLSASARRALAAPIFSHS